MEIRKITADCGDTDTICRWMYEWWGEKEGHTYEETECYIKHSMLENRLPMTFGLYDGGEIKGVYQLRYDDLWARPDIYPWLANLYVPKSERGKGYGKAMMESVPAAAKENMGKGTLYLMTQHIGLYEKFGWRFLGEIDPHAPAVGVQRLYAFNID